MSQPMTPPENRQPVLPVAALTDEIKTFMKSAEQRLPTGYIDAFRALIDRLVQTGIGQTAPDIGTQFPDFVLLDDKANPVRASDHWNENTLVVKFYRGGWCPYCHLELAALQRHAPEFAAANAVLLAVAPEKPSFQQVTQKTAAADFRFLWDENNAFARQLGIAFVVDDAVREVYLKLDLDLDAVNGEWILPVPATFVVSNGIVEYRNIDADYMRRQDPADLLAVLRELNDPMTASVTADESSVQSGSSHTRLK